MKLPILLGVLYLISSMAACDSKQNGDFRGAGTNEVPITDQDAATPQGVDAPAPPTIPADEFKLSFSFLNPRTSSPSQPGLFELIVKVESIKGSFSIQDFQVLTVTSDMTDLQQNVFSTTVNPNDTLKRAFTYKYFENVGGTIKYEDQILRVVVKDNNSGKQDTLDRNVYVFLCRPNETTCSSGSPWKTYKGTEGYSPN